MLEQMEPELSRLTTLRIGGKAIACLLPQNREDLLAAHERAACLGGRLMPIGRGSNILADDGHLPLVLISLDKFADIRTVAEEDGQILVRAGAGASLAALLRFCLQNCLTGLEGLVGIPGRVGGACAMNAGSFGVETGEKIWQMETLDESGASLHARASLQLRYRALNLQNYKQLPIVTSVIFALTRGSKSDILRRMNLNYFEKKFRQPLGAWSAGCAFKNPAKGLSAGRLLDDAGLKGKKLGGMTFSSKHANFLINEGNGSAAAAFELLDLAVASVQAKHDVRLEPEVRILRWH